MKDMKNLYLWKTGVMTHKKGLTKLTSWIFFKLMRIDYKIKSK